MKLYHENYKPSRSEYLKRQKKKFTEGYHLQKLPSEYFYEVVRYIKSHDQDTVKKNGKKEQSGGIAGTGRNRIEKQKSGRKTGIVKI